MLFPCPACGKQQPVHGTGVRACDRCGCDLSALCNIRLAAMSLLRQAKSALARGAWDDALANASGSWTLMHDATSASVVCLAAAALGDADTLARWRYRAG